MANPPDGRIGGGADFGVVAAGVRKAIARRVFAVPLTERMLSRLPGPRVAWMVGWALVPWLNLAVLAWGAGEWAGTGVPVVEVLNRAAVSFAVLLSLWGAARIAAEPPRNNRSNYVVLHAQLVRPTYRDVSFANRKAGLAISGVWIPTTTSPSFRYFSFQARICGSVRIQLMQV
jgi:hypothetical protein